RLYGVYCNTGFGNASDARMVAVRNSGELEGSETDVFVTFDQSPEAAWQDNDRLLIVVNGVSPLHKSLPKAKDVEIVYRLRSDLTEEHIRRLMRIEQRRTPEDFHDNVRERYESFIRWASKNAEMN